jgi:multidrug efflux pump subunit AcrB
MGFDLSLMSMMGVVALAGVVVNDSLILVVSANRYRESGMAAFDAAVAGGSRRFRPIILTSLTTFFGLAPMILETSVQARFLIPMAVSLGFGVMFATLITLLMVPALYMIVDDAARGLRRLRDWFNSDLRRISGSFAAVSPDEDDNPSPPAGAPTRHT